MNIQEAKIEIARTFRAYTRRMPDGSHRIPTQKQRPVLLIGPPGVGKTAIMRQIADEIDCGLVAYSMTHHTRQSAIGLPFISRKVYDGVTRSVTEYTMSEIVASIYDTMERTGKRSGILFLDEINCVSETLTPVMLQLLQNKTFGNVPLPEDWIIVAAGNPPEYNKSVRELDMVTLDRVKHIEVEADLAVWQDYARRQGVHPAIRTYLHVYPDHFYKIKDTDRGQLFVTARGWEDLSLMLGTYEEDGVEVNAKWFLQYLQYDEIARSFGLYYDLFRRFSAFADPEASDFSVSELLRHDPERLSGLTSTECLSVAAMLLHPIEQEAEGLSERQRRLARRRDLASLFPSEDALDEESVDNFFGQKRKAMEIKVAHNVMKRDEEYRESAALALLEEDVARWRKLSRGERGDFRDYEAAEIGKEADALDAAAERVSAAVEEAYQTLSRCPRGRSAILYLANDLAASAPCREILAAHPSNSHEARLREIE